MENIKEVFKVRVDEVREDDEDYGFIEGEVYLVSKFNDDYYVAVEEDKIVDGLIIEKKCCTRLD